MYQLDGGQRHVAVRGESGRYSSRDAALASAVLATLAYADVFDFPLERDEIYRYCLSPGGSRAQVDAAINHLLTGGRIRRHGEYLFLAGRQETVFHRRRLEQISRPAWRQARRWGAVMWLLPFVRMVAVTGSLAVNGSEAEGDIDYLIVVERGRLWLVRGLFLLLWRLARLLGAPICPNYFVSTRALAMEQRDLYTARELAQMVPLHGGDIARQIWAANRWIRNLLPNADLDIARLSDAQAPLAYTLKRWLEWLLAAPLLDRWEAWERERKIAQLSAAGTTESAFSADVCKDHSQQHGHRVLQRYARRRTQLAAADEVEHKEPAPAHERPVGAHRSLKLP